VVLIGAYCLLTAMHGQQALTIAGIQCPPNITAVAAGSDLSDLFPAKDTTFLLAPGDYTITRPLAPYNDPFFGNVTSLYNGTICFSGQGASRADVKIQVQLEGSFAEAPDPLASESAAFFLDVDLRGQSVMLGLKGLTLDGGARFGGASVGLRATLAVESVVMQNLARLSGSAVIVSDGIARLSDVQFLGNTANTGGAVACVSIDTRPTTLELDKVCETPRGQRLSETVRRRLCCLSKAVPGSNGTTIE
jgi:predicted outer membrane repeat protein